MGMDTYDSAAAMRRLRQKRIDDGKCYDCGKPSETARCKTCGTASNNRGKRQWKDIRAQVLKGYGARCVCCGETEPFFLNLDHVEGGHREDNVTTYRRAIREGFPSTLRILCYNCNLGREHTANRSCPHETKRAEGC